jgi:hypothetical protein
MLMAKLHNGKVLSSIEYSPESHGTRLFCLDKNGNAPLIYIQGSEVRAAHFKTSGKGDSIHKSECGFYQPLDQVESIDKIREYQRDGYRMK